MEIIYVALEATVPLTDVLWPPIATRGSRMIPIVASLSLRCRSPRIFGWSDPTVTNQQFLRNKNIYVVNYRLNVHLRYTFNWFLSSDNANAQVCSKHPLPNGLPFLTSRRAKIKLYLYKEDRGPASSAQNANSLPAVC